MPPQHAGFALVFSDLTREAVSAAEPMHNRLSSRSINLEAAASVTGLVTHARSTVMEGLSLTNLLQIIVGHAPWRTHGGRAVHERLRAHRKVA
jgi:hypothetical protein